MDREFSANADSRSAFVGFVPAPVIPEALDKSSNIVMIDESLRPGDDSTCDRDIQRVASFTRRRADR
jgi:hypothetical protein